jgi:hypothetical protein
MERKVRRGGLVGPVILIGLGVVFLLNNLGILEWSVLELVLRLWPALLIATGVDLLVGRRSAWGSLLALVLIVAVFAGAVWLMVAGEQTGWSVAERDFSWAPAAATEAEVVIAPAVGAVHVDALTRSDVLVEGVARLGRGEGVTPEFSVEGEKATVVLRATGTSVGPFLGGWGGQRGWDVGLSPEVPLDLEVSIAVGQATVDLTNLTVADLKVSTGLGQATVTLPDEGRFDGRIEGAIGETVVVIPAGLAVRIEVDTGIAGRQLPGDLVREDNVYTSPGYATADNRVNLKVSQPIGNIVVRHARGN